MSQARFLAGALLALAAGSGARSAQAEPARPDVLLLLVDGLATKSSPAVDRLARHARVFERAYLPNAVAGPCRAAILLGRRPERVDVQTELAVKPENTTLLTEVFARGGYALVRIGQASGGELDTKIPWDQALTPDAGTDTAKHVAAVLDAPRDRPRFIMAGFDELGPVGGYPEGAAGGAVLGERPAISIEDQSFLSRPGRKQVVRALSEPARQKLASAQEARARRFDDELGRIGAALDRGQRWSSTVVLLAGTQAPVSAEHGALTRADDLFEDTVRVPLLVAAPGLPAPGQSTESLVDVADVYPTLVELAGLPATSGLDAQSVASIVRDPKAAGRTAVASVVIREAGHLGRSVRTDRYRFSEWPDGSVELYDHKADPAEHKNIATLPSVAPTLAQMKALVDERESELPSVGAPAPQPVAQPSSSLSRPPNVLLIVADDMTMQLGAYGFPVRTPNIDRLARMGRRFEHAYAQVAMCSPSRTSLLSGWRPERSGVWENTEEPRQPGMMPIQEYFGHAGYFTASIGKIWETAWATDFHWDVLDYEPPGERKGKEDPAAIVRGGPGWWGKTSGRDEDTPDGRRARRVAQLIEEKRDRPFFIALGFAKPHLRWIVPAHYFDLYDPAQIEPPPPPDDLLGVPAIAIKRELTRPGAPLAGQEPPGMMPDPELRKQALAAYYATVTFVDTQLGVVMDALDRQNLWGSTVVVLTSDHGYHLGEHRGLWRKDTLFEEAVHVPLIVTAPGLSRPGTSSSAVVEQLDLYPTLVDVAGLPKVPGIDGRSLAPMLKDPAASVVSCALSLRQVRAASLGVSVRSGRWRFTQWPDGSEELFDLDKDPKQRENLAGRADLQNVILDLRARRVELVP